jgi:hypothetical protein
MVLVFIGLGIRWGSGVGFLGLCGMDSGLLWL